MLTSVRGRGRTAEALGLLLLLLLVGPLTVLSVGASPVSERPFAAGQPLLVDGLPSMQCNDAGEPLAVVHWNRGVPCGTPDRMPTVPAGAEVVEAPGWWFQYGPDRDANGMDDRLQRILAGEYESQSPTNVTGNDGRATVAIILDFAWHPRAVDLEAVRTILVRHGWVGPEGGAEFFTVDSLDSVLVDKVPLPALIELWQLDGVVVIEQQNVMVPLLDIAAAATKVRANEVYSRTLRERGLNGSGVVIAVVDSGVDNEHRSLNDFDDRGDEPDLDPGSYDDQKWVAGFDATNSLSAVDGSEDPDDGNEHGTHVAGIALGTGDSRRVHQGMAPGAYLVDVKTLVDVGGTNSQNSIRGINWIQQNAGTDWGNNDSSRGIDIATMSFGSVQNPQGDDTGDNGQSGEARAVNALVDAGVIAIVAIGNDGNRRVPSPGSADRAITVGALDDRNTVNRSDDRIASYSNYGPRDDDGDGDDWDELKPDVVAYGSGIVSAEWAAGAAFPGQERPMADDGYHSLQGTSMSTPLVAGVVALLLEADSALRPQEVKDLIRNNSEARGDPTRPATSDVWNDRFGFGMLDARALLDTLRGEEDEGGDDTPPPVGEGAGPWVDIWSVENDTWFVTNETHRIRGEVDPPAGRDIVQVQVQVHDSNWTVAQGTTNWSVDVPIEAWRDPGQRIWIQARAQDQFGVWSNPDLRGVYIGPFELNFGSPAAGTRVSDDVTLTGTWAGIDADHVEIRIDSEEWIDVPLGNAEESHERWSRGSFTYTWDSTLVEDGTHRLSVRLVNASGETTEAERHRITVDNLPPAPDLSLRGSVRIESYGVPVDNAYVQTYLEIRAEISNEGDLVGEDVEITFEEEGVERSATVLSSLGIGESASIVLYWTPATPGERSVRLSLDPRGTSGDGDREDNSQNLTFEVLQRPAGVDLSIRRGDVTTRPAIPHPGEPFLVEVRVENLGRTEASGAVIVLWEEVDGRWQERQRQDLPRVSGQSHTFATPMSLRFLVSGHHQMRVTLEGTTDLEPANDLLEFGILVDEMTLLGAAVEPPLADDDVPLAWASFDEGGVLFSERGGELYGLGMSPTKSFLSASLLEERVKGGVASAEDADGNVHVAWTRSFVDDDDGLLKLDVVHAIMDRRGEVLRLNPVMPPLLPSDGIYYGLSLARTEDTLVLAGYHRTLFENGAYIDETSIFIARTDDPFDGASWEVMPDVVDEIELPTGQADPVAVAYEEDKERVHLLYQSRRRDGGGSTRLGLFYAHGPADEDNWTFDMAVGDHAAQGSLILFDTKDGVRLAAAWREHTGADSVLVTHVTDTSWNTGDPLRVLAPGTHRIVLAPQPDGPILLHDEVGPLGPFVRIGRLMWDEGNDEAIHGHGSPLTSGRLLDVGLADEDLHLVTWALDGELEVRSLVLAPTDDDDDDNWLRGFNRLVNSDNGRILVGVFLLVGILALITPLTRKQDKRSARGEPAPLLLPETWPDDDLDPDDEIEILDRLPDDDEVEVHSHPVEEELTVRAPAVASDSDDLQREGDVEVHVNEARRRRQHRRMQRLEQERLEQGLGLGGGDTAHLAARDVPTASELAAAVDDGPVFDPAGNLVPGGLPLPPPPEFLAGAATTAAPSAVETETPAFDPRAFSTDREVSCPECSARFTVTDTALTLVHCPACSTRIDL